MIIEGYITIDNEYDNMPQINNESICSYLEKLITNERSHKGIDTGYVKWKNKGLGEKHYYLKDCKMRAYYSRERCSFSITSVDQNYNLNSLKVSFGVSNLNK